jgi:hypothetical protein
MRVFFFLMSAMCFCTGLVLTAGAVLGYGTGAVLAFCALGFHLIALVSMAVGDQTT